MISVVIPSYKNATYLNLCLQSAIEYQHDLNQIIVVLDGPDEEGKEVATQFSDAVDLIELETNRGESVAHNIGVTLAESNRILIVNSDNVFPPEWDTKLNAVFDPAKIFSPNQIEPETSIFSSFHIRDLGKTPETFQFDTFEKISNELSNNSIVTSPDGQTWPVFMDKKWYMILGGIDERFPFTAAADWDFFMRAELAGLICERLNTVNFYHFAGAGTRTPESMERRQQREMQSFEYFLWKWGFLPDRFNSRNSAVPAGKFIRGVEMPIYP